MPLVILFIDSIGFDFALLVLYSCKGLAFKAVNREKRAATVFYGHKLSASNFATATACSIMPARPCVFKSERFRIKLESQFILRLVVSNYILCRSPRVKLKMIVHREVFLGRGIHERAFYTNWAAIITALSSTRIY